MSDFYSELGAMENEALRRARRMNEAEREAVRSFNSSIAAPSPEHHRHHAPPPEHPHKPGNPLGGLLGGSFLNGELLSSPDLSIILLLFLILRSDNNDPLLMLALMYILM